MVSNLLIRLAQALDEAQIPYMLIGGQAVLLYGEPRLTRDVDITVGLPPREVERVMEVIHRVDLRLLVQNPRDFVQKTWVLPTLDEETGLRVDFIFSWTPYEQEALGRAREVKIKGYPVRFASPEDVIIHKVIAGRPRDLEDVRTILRKQTLDLAYIRKWLHRFSTSLGTDFFGRFEEVLQSVEGGHPHDPRPPVH